MRCSDIWLDVAPDANGGRLPVSANVDAVPALPAVRELVQSINSHAQLAQSQE